MGQPSLPQFLASLAGTYAPHLLQARIFWTPLPAALANASRLAASSSASRSCRPRQTK